MQIALRLLLRPTEWQLGYGFQRGNINARRSRYQGKVAIAWCRLFFLQLELTWLERRR